MLLVQRRRLETGERRIRGTDDIIIVTFRLDPDPLDPILHRGACLEIWDAMLAG